MTSFMKTDYLSAASLSSTLSRVTPLSGPGSSATTISIQSTPCSSKRSPSGAADPPIIGWQPNIKSHNISTPNLIYAGSPATKSTSAFVAEDLNVTPLPSQKSSVASSSPIACSTAQLVTVIIIGREPITLCRPQPPISTLPTTPAITSTSPPQKAWQIDDKVLTSAPSPTYTPANNILETFAVLSSAVVVDDHTLTPGSPALTVDGNIISLGFSIFVIGTKTEDWATGAATNPAVASSIGIGELILKGFGQIGGTVLSASSTTTSTPTSPPTTPIPTTTASSPLTTIPPLDLIVGSETLTFVSDNILIAGQTLTPGSPGITVDGELISLGSSLFIEGTTVTQTYSTTVSVPSATTILSTSTFKPLVTSSPRSKAPQSSATTTASTSSSTSQPPGPAYTYDGTPFSSSSASGWRQWRIPVEAGAALMLFPFILSL
ncbi:MAG: hypothetical protein MMC33_000310 [Icmadophila ericetorum]|nr:hypothetical protein [Icmadophila ericetorum]